LQYVITYLSDINIHIIKLCECAVIHLIKEKVMPSVYIEMDGILSSIKDCAEFDLGQPLAGLMPTSDEWFELSKKQPRFFQNLPEILMGRTRILNVARAFENHFRYDIKILTGIYRHPDNSYMTYTFQDKLWWMKHFNQNIPVIFAPDQADKPTYYLEGDILIDTSKDICQQWRARGGSAVVVTQDFEQSANEFKALFFSMGGPEDYPFNWPE